MKNFKLFTLVMLATALVFSSCSKDEEEVAKPTIKFVGNYGSDVDFTPATEMTKEIVFNANLAAEAKIKSFTITEKKYGTSTATNPYDADNTKKAKGEVSYTYNFSKTLSHSDLSGGVTKIEYIFEVTDKEGNNVEKIFTVNVVTTTSTPLANEENGVIFNLQGLEKGAWDLVNDMAKAANDNDADKDMANTTGGNAVFKKEWEAKNATMFVKVTGMTYDEFSSEEAAKGYYSSKTPVTKVENVAANDIYVAKLRGEDNYAVIKITNVVETPNDNNDKIEFTYKKK